jgi:hypothetical protein
MLFNPSRNEARNFLFESWRKHKARELLTPLEDLAAQLIAKHPEYFAVLENPQQYQEKDYSPEQGAANPFLHLMMHLTIEEQISIDQPKGIRAQFVRLAHKLESEHDAHHWLILHGRYVCQARKPKCGACIIYDLCEYKDKDK